MDLNLNTPIYELDFSVRTENCLIKAEIVTLGKLLKCSDVDLLSIRHMGRKCVNEIKCFMEENGINFNDSLDCRFKFDGNLIDAELRYNNLIEQRKQIDIEINALGYYILKERTNLAKHKTIYDCLTDRQQEALRCKIEHKKLKETSLLMSITVERVRQILGVCYRRLRSPMMKHLREEIHKIGICDEVFNGNCEICKTIDNRG